MNIPKLLTDLHNWGVKQAVIAGKCGCSQGQVSKIWHGLAEPRLREATAIETLHAAQSKRQARKVKA